MNLFKGKLSYFLAILAVLGGGAGWLLGFVDDKATLEMVWGGLALFGLRRAVN